MNLKPQVEVRFSEHWIVIEGSRVSRPPYITPSTWIRFWSVRLPRSRVHAGLLERPITDFTWSKRALAIFRFSDPPIKTLADLTDRTQLDIALMPNCGQVTVAEILTRLAELGLSLKERNSNVTSTNPSPPRTDRGDSSL